MSKDWCVVGIDKTVFQLYIDKSSSAIMHGFKKSIRKRTKKDENYAQDQLQAAITIQVLE